MIDRLQQKTTTKDLALTYVGERGLCNGHSAIGLHIAPK